MKNQGLLKRQYEFAGFHSPILDLCNPFFIDGFFDLVSSDAIDEEVGVTANFRNGRVEIQMNRAMDQLNCAILEIKTRYLVTPLCAFLESEGMPLSGVYEQIASALFICGVSKFHWAGGWQALFARMAVGVVCSQIRNIADLQKVWKMLCLNEIS